MAKVISPLAPEALGEFVVERKTRSKERGVCSCGHSMNRHYQTAEGQWSCTPTRIYCGCRQGNPVLTAKNLRLFLFKTTGAGIEHALGKGILACIESGSEFEWVGGAPVCQACKTVTDSPIPVSLDTYGVGEDGKALTRPVNQSSKYDVVVCPSCYTAKWG